MSRRTARGGLPRRVRWCRCPRRQVPRSRRGAVSGRRTPSAGRPPRAGRQGGDVEVIYFPAPADFRKWLEKNAVTASELVVGYYKKGSGRPSMTWPESV